MPKKKTRIYGDKANIDVGHVKDFFNKRASLVKDDDILTATMYQPKDNSEKRNAMEKELFLRLFDLKKTDKVIEVGCGAGRWARNLHDRIEEYLGIDYSEKLIKHAVKQNNLDNVKFQVMSASDIRVKDLLVRPPFDIVIVSGLMIYMNDDELLRMARSISSFESAALYIKEPVSLIGERLTLRDFFSEDLCSEYNAIYRTPAEMETIFGCLEGLELVNTGKAYSEELQKHKETEHRYFVFRRK